MKKERFPTGLHCSRCAFHSARERIRGFGKIGVKLKSYMYTNKKQKVPKMKFLLFLKICAAASYIIFIQNYALFFLWLIMYGIRFSVRVDYLHIVQK